VQIKNRLLPLPRYRVGSMGSEIFLDSKRGHGINMFLAHYAHSFGADLEGMVDGRDPGLSSIQSSGFSSSMHCNAFANSSRFTNGRAELSFSVLIRSRKAAIVDGIRSGFINLREIRSLLELLAHHLDQLLGVIGKISIGQDVLRRVVS